MPLIHRPFRRVGIVNRGEAAVRFLRAARAWARRRREPLEVVALYTTPDRDAVFVREADEAVALGDALVAGPEGLRSAYLDIPRVLRLLTAAGCDAVWPGWGFVSERPDFADACAAAGLVFIGPSGESMRLLGDKIAGKRLAETHGVPVTAWSGGPVADVDEAVSHADRIGYPVLLKAAAGGGGRGIRIVRAADELAGAFASAAHEARAAFGDATLLVEAFAPEARHVEVQVIADAHGRVHAVGTRDCSMQRRHQKVLEEAPAPGLGALDARLREAAVAVARASQYVNAGTAEFLVLPDRSGFYFLEMNTRLQVEHPVTEAVTGLDLVGLQIDVARGESLPDALPATRGHAIEARLNAEDADAGFRPSAGRLLRFELATAPAVRIDSGFVEGDVVPGEFDSMLAKVIAVGPTREEALARLDEALNRSTVAIEGGASNRSLLMELVNHDAFRAGPVTTRWLDRHLTQRALPLERRHLDGALIAAAIGEAVQARAEEVGDLMRQAHRGLPSHVVRPEPRTVRFCVGEAAVSLEVTALSPTRYRVACEHAAVEVGHVATGACTALLTLRGRRYPVTLVTTPTALHVEVDSVAHRLERASDGRVVAPVPGAVTHVFVREGDVVSAGARLLTLEVMKMEVAITAPIAGRVARVLVEPAARVTPGHALVHLEGAGLGAAVPTGPGFALTPDAPGDVPTRTGVTLLAALLGYDPPPASIDEALAHVARGEVNVGRKLLSRLLDAFISHERLFEPATGLGETAPVDLLARHLRFLGDGDPELPEAFRARLLAALAWHDVAALDAGPRHRDALLRILQAHAGLTIRAEIMLAVLTAALEEVVPERTPAERDAFRDRLEAFAALVVRRDTVLAEAAYAALYHLCDRPRQLVEARGLATAARAAVEALVSPDCAAEERARLEAELEALPKGALLSVVRDPLALSEPVVRATLLDLLVRRMHITARRLQALPGDAAGLYEVGVMRVAAVLTTPQALFTDVVRALSGPPFGGEDDPPTDVDVFLSEPAVSWVHTLESDGPASLAGLPACVRRFSVNWGSVELGRLSRTFLRGADGAFIEDRFLRDFHPARIEWRELDRLRAFDVERVPAPGEIFLAVARAREDASDERLIGIVEVERFDPERDPQTGKLLRVPSFERVYMTTLHAMRQAHRMLKQSPKPFWNRLVVYVRPRLTVTMDEIRHTTRRLAPATAGLGIEVMILRGHMPDPAAPAGLRPLQIDWTNPTNHGATLTIGPHAYHPVSPLRADERRVIEARRKGQFYPYELARALSQPVDGVFPRGSFTELELAANANADGETLVPADRPHGQNTAHLVVGRVVHHFATFPEGLPRVLILGDPTRGMGSLAEPECRRILAAFDLAEREGLAVEWVAVSSGARIAMDSGTENLDWTARVLARIIRFTQAGGTVNVIVDGVNVGAQSYWNAEATMLQHCRGALIMTPQGSMLLTGKKALEYAGSVSAEDNNGIGGFARIMGPNGEAQYFAQDLTAAYQLLFRHLAVTAVAPGEARPRRRVTGDPIDRDVTVTPYPAEGALDYRTIGDLFDEAINPGRKRPFAIRPVMRAVLDHDLEPLERWAPWHGAESAVVFEGSLGGDAVCCIGIESRPVPRKGEAPADGPDHWTSGTLFPQSSKKVARAINAASGARPVVVVANLSGFDGSPESLRHGQLELGAEIGRAVVNFRGPLCFCVVSRYHGGAYVVFSRALNPGLNAAALEGSFASVIGGGPAAAVVFPGLVRKRANADPVVVEARRALEAARLTARASATAEFERVLREATSRHQAAVAREFDAIHSVERARSVGSLDAVITARTLRPYLIECIRAGGVSGTH
jgi:acetyl/propionyl-CoA carboxylase alpha subunit/acetyl-CoA carboxylase carboxyltransferase component